MKNLIIVIAIIVIAVILVLIFWSYLCPLKDSNMKEVKEQVSDSLLQANLIRSDSISATEIVDGSIAGIVDGSLTSKEDEDKEDEDIITEIHDGRISLLTLPPERLAGTGLRPTLEHWNKIILERITDAKYRASTSKSGLACNVCGTEMIYPTQDILTTNPSKRLVICPKCGAHGYEILY